MTLELTLTDTEIRDALAAYVISKDFSLPENSTFRIIPIEGYKYQAKVNVLINERI